MKFLDEVKVYTKSGDGGAGCMSFRREKFVEFGGPNGGNGGRGGDIIIQAVDNLNTLIDYRYQQHFKAPKGGHGMGASRTGGSGKNIILKVPVGTQVFEEDGEDLVVDMITQGQEHVLLKGGDGGFGNEHYKTSTNQAPRRSDQGWPGQEKWLWLKLKLIADVGLVGLPNAGKSTFLQAVSRTKPKIADYPFTTLTPQLGMVYCYDDEFVVADLPGLISDASLGKGLGHRFLKHTERCGVLLHLIDLNQEDPVGAYEIIRRELEEYNPILSKKHEVIALNKKELVSKDFIDKIIKAIKKKQKVGNIFVISAAMREGIEPVIKKLYEYVALSRKPIESDKACEALPEGAE